MPLWRLKSSPNTMNNAAPASTLPHDLDEPAHAEWLRYSDTPPDRYPEGLKYWVRARSADVGTAPSEELGYLVAEWLKAGRPSVCQQINLDQRKAPKEAPAPGPTLAGLTLADRMTAALTCAPEEYVQHAVMVAELYAQERVDALLRQQREQMALAVQAISSVRHTIPEIDLSATLLHSRDCLDLAIASLRGSK